MHLFSVYSWYIPTDDISDNNRSDCTSVFRTHWVYKIYKQPLRGVWCVLCLLHTCKKKIIWFSTYLAWFYWKGSSLHLWSDWDKSFGMTGTFYWSESFTLPVIEVTLITKAIELRRYFFPIRKLVIMIKKNCPNTK